MHRISTLLTIVALTASGGCLASHVNDEPLSEPFDQELDGAEKADLWGKTQDAPCLFDFQCVGALVCRPIVRDVLEHRAFHCRAPSETWNNPENRRPYCGEPCANAGDCSQLDGATFCFGIDDRSNRPNRGVCVPVGTDPEEVCIGTTPRPDDSPETVPPPLLENAECDVSDGIPCAGDFVCRPRMLQSEGEFELGADFCLPLGQRWTFQEPDPQTYREERTQYCGDPCTDPSQCRRELVCYRYRARGPGVCVPPGESASTVCGIEDWWPSGGEPLP